MLSPKCGVLSHPIFSSHLGNDCSWLENIKNCVFPFFFFILFYFSCNSNNTTWATMNVPAQPMMIYRCRKVFYNLVLLLLFNFIYTNDSKTNLFNIRLATVQKLINEMMPNEIACAKDTRDLLIDSCVGKFIIYGSLYCTC